MNKTDPMQTTDCPECGDPNYHVETYFDEGMGNNMKGSEHRFCEACGQEYFTDTDYSATGDI